MSRDTILKAVRAANSGRRAFEATPVSRLSSTTTDPASLTAAFVTRMTACGVIVEELPSPADIPEAVLRYVTAARLPLTLRHGSDAMIAALPWHKAPDLQRETGAATPETQAALSRALCGIAETGTLLLGSGAENPVTLAFLPDLHIVVLDSASIVETIDEGFCFAEAETGAVRLPRTVNLISGASRTGDIGGRLVMGAHGPRQLVVLTVTKNGAA